jgi:hypothetical protein
MSPGGVELHSSPAFKFRRLLLYFAAVDTPCRWLRIMLFISKERQTLSQDRVICAFCVGKGGDGETNLPENIKTQRRRGTRSKTHRSCDPTDHRNELLVSGLLSKQRLIFLISHRIRACTRQQLGFTFLHSFAAKLFHDAGQLQRIVFNRLWHSLHELA